MTRSSTDSGGEEDAQGFYSRWAGLYDLLARRTPGITGLRRRAAATCRLEPGDTVIEMGCGTGANLPYLREAVGREGTVIGLDFTQGVLERANRRHWNDPIVHLVRGNATTAPIDGDVDAVLATFVVGMLDDPAAAVDDWCDLVGSGGHVVLVNAAPSATWYAIPVNAVLHAVTVLSTPPTWRFRYDRSPLETLDERVTAAHEQLRSRSEAVAHDTQTGGVVRVTGGRIA